MSDRDRLLKMIRELVSIPSITESDAESEPAFWIKERLGAHEYFKEHPKHLRLIETPLEGKTDKLFSLIARVDASAPTKRTVLLIGHFDVVDTKPYGDIAEHAFNPDELAKILGPLYGTDDVLYGRGSMDMKCGVALETDLLEQFADNRYLFDVNIIAAFVGDEENSSAGMRGVLPFIYDMKTDEGLDFLAALNTEPGEAGKTGHVGPMVFLGTLGKLMPSFYVKGRPAHVGNCYSGFSSALAVSHIICESEGNPSLSSPLHGISQPSWICLDMRVMKEGYSVTIPDRAYAYFNCFTTTDTPASVMESMLSIASNALRRTNEQLLRSYEGLACAGYDGSEFAPLPVKVYTFNDIVGLAREKNGAEFDEALKNYVNELPSGDMRERGIKIVDRIADMSGEEGPYIICFFLPPWLPVRTDFTEDAGDIAVVEAARAVENELLNRYGMKMTEVELFAGLCDLSYAGARVSEDDINALKDNMPGWGSIYRIPLEEMQKISMPVINVGPSGEDPHKKTERLHLRYSIDILPDILKSVIREISARVPTGNRN